MALTFVVPEEFFRLLYSDSEFCSGVGKIMLAAGRLEAGLRQHLRARAIGQVRSTSTLGSMVALLKTNRLLTRNGEMHFDDLVIKRNYLAHRMYALFSGELASTILPRNELVAEDIVLFTERAHALASDFMHFAVHVEAANPKDRVLL